MKKTIISAPAGIQGIFEIGGDTGWELYLDAVVAIAILTHDEDEVFDGKHLATAPMGIGLDGSVALALVGANGVVHSEGSSWPNLARWLEDQAGERTFVKHQFGDDAVPPTADPLNKTGIFT